MVVHLGPMSCTPTDLSCVPPNLDKITLYVFSSCTRNGPLNSDPDRDYTTLHCQPWHVDQQTIPREPANAAFFSPTLIQIGRKPRSNAAFTSRPNRAPSRHESRVRSCVHVGVFRDGPSDTKPEIDKVLAKTRSCFVTKTTCIGKVEKAPKTMNMISFGRQDLVATTQRRNKPSYLTSRSCPTLTSLLDLFP